MPPKQATAADGAPKVLLDGFEDKETKLLAAAFVSSVGLDKYDYEIMSNLTGNTAGSLKKMWPPVKKKAMEAYASFASFLGNTGPTIASGEPKTPAPAKAKGGRKRKAEVEADGETSTKDAEDRSATIEKSDGAGDKSDTKTITKKKAPAKKAAKRAKKEVKTEVQEDDSADGGDGLDAAKEGVELAAEEEV
ncbi:hypothetical protein DE146DRAFT_406629 [Phaeosphaeria sp. MPI-PUGE-AT-0046c]|nr:hypothetical protein DE146DRAFT_406629 [Phaeosphaeria sp. MPI-PUGE-AT-0046c]